MGGKFVFCIAENILFDTKFIQIGLLDHMLRSEYNYNGNNGGHLENGGHLGFFEWLTGFFN